PGFSAKQKFSLRGFIRTGGSTVAKPVRYLVNSGGHPMNRRKFVGALGGAIAVWPSTARGQSSPSSNPVRQDWLDRHTEAILEPDLPIVDPHHHLWIRPGWRYLADDLMADINSGHNIIATVFVQAHSMYRASGPIEMRSVGETEFVNGV